MNKKFSPGKALELVIENGVFLIAAFMLFLKTSELLGTFAPAEFLGYTGIGPIYGIVCALLVEGLLVVAKLNLSRTQSSWNWLYSLLLILVTFTLSAMAQVADGFLIRQTLANQPMAIQYLVNYGVPLVPSIILALVLGKSIVGSLPEMKADPAPAKVARIPSSHG